MARLHEVLADSEDGALLAEIIAMFLENAPQYLAALRQEAGAGMPKVSELQRIASKGAAGIWERRVWSHSVWNGERSVPLAL